MAGAFEDGVCGQRKKETVGRDTGTAPLKQVTLCLLAEDLLERWSTLPGAPVTLGTEVGVRLEEFDELCDG